MSVHHPVPYSLAPAPSSGLESGRLFSRLLFRLQLLVIGRFVDTEFLIEIVVVDGDVEVLLQLREDGYFGTGIRFLRFGETERTPFGVDAHAQQNVRHVVIQHVEHVLPVGLQYLVLYFLMNRTQSLRAFFGRFGGQRIAQYQFGNFVVAPLAEAFIDIGRPCFVSGFREFEFRVLGMEELRQTSGIGRILHGPLA